LNFCEDQRERHANVDDYREDISNLMTLAKMMHFYHDHRNASHHFHEKIRLNAFKYAGKVAVISVTKVKQLK
jgi:hypothetical protein